MPDPLWVETCSSTVPGSSWEVLSRPAAWVTAGTAEAGVGDVKCSPTTDRKRGFTRCGLPLINARSSAPQCQSYSRLVARRQGTIGLRPGADFARALSPRLHTPPRLDFPLLCPGTVPNARTLSALAPHAITGSGAMGRSARKRISYGGFPCALSAHQQAALG